MNNLIANYERILEVLRKISKEQLLPYQRRKPKMSDLELISLALTSEFMGIDSENDLFRKLPNSILKNIERSVYNRRRRKLSYHINEIRLKIASYFNEFEEYFIVDSMLWKFVNSQEVIVLRFVLIIMAATQIKVIVLHKKQDTMAINFTQFVQ